ncbi:hypothetical protein BOO69_04730 [Sulfitobacter alexandrii]|uniref:Amine oxidase domain-containing protein n=1 Tax=Sulfitobacter alexandrii TaxID=1917485 RepID=A0A1J0WER4_9RHOB|nr:FAD-dependent oxidoreductase [Sulfitobacter alexandrii]APE42804.1 hypothetical protein BOO69_04730 [Sulfitobacter alexandrii]
MKTAVIGAGMAGLSCARLLQRAGRDVTVFDKGRGLGGRMATRRAGDGLQFDHGAQYVTAKDDGFAELLARAQAAGQAGTWPRGGPQDGKTRYVGVPGMTGLAKFMAEGLDIRRGHAVTAMRDTGHGAEIEIDGQRLAFDRVVCTAPVPQIIALLGQDHPLVPAPSRITYDPCLTLMVALDRPFPDLPDHHRAPEADLAWIAQDGGKPERPEGNCWVAQASPEWSRRHLELEKDHIVEAMLPLFLDRLRIDPARVIHRAAHRWRYARVTAPLGRPFLASDNNTLYLGGDGFIGPRVEAAYLSGCAIAREMLDTA